MSGYSLRLHRNCFCSPIPHSHSSLITARDEKNTKKESIDVYLVTTIDPIPLEAFTLQETRVSAVKYVSYDEIKGLLANLGTLIHHLEIG